MRIKCPYCGERDSAEFVYRGDATVQRPAGALLANDQAWNDYVYLRANKAGPMHEHWYHASGCHAWLRVERDVRTHAITASEFARQVEECS